MLIAWLDRETLGPVLRAILRVGPVLGGVALLLWRVRETQVPITVTSIVIPPLAMSSAFGMCPPGECLDIERASAIMSGFEPTED